MLEHVQIKINLLNTCISKVQIPLNKMNLLIKNALIIINIDFVDFTGFEKWVLEATITPEKPSVTNFAYSSSNQ